MGKKKKKKEKMFSPILPQFGGFAHGIKKIFGHFQSCWGPEYTLDEKKWGKKRKKEKHFPPFYPNVGVLRME
jgi:hypothetical protein